MNFLPNLQSFRILLASKSPRRRELLQKLGIPFEVIGLDVDESYPADLPTEAIPLYLARLKAQPFRAGIDRKTLVITADTIVSVEGQVLGKPRDNDEARSMLQSLSGRWHTVSTGVFLLSEQKELGFTSETRVRFKELSAYEIDHYIEEYKPFDKAGAYGIQEWIGYVAVERIEGSYFNVIGLPVQRLYEALLDF
ncbi:MAG TPA: Maf family nucleotide pyrophosphatase [Prolixibacteraceae bacterium]|nr:Maf family nucleotide pyrophosphatase [Prolixibacteraceae bacterium]